MLSDLLSMSRGSIRNVLDMARDERLQGQLLPPVEPGGEVWASGVTYLRSRVEREAESTVADVYAKVYEAERPEIFFKALGTRVVGHGEKIRIRKDSDWNVPEPELTLVINRHGEIVGYTAGNDVSSRSIEGENPLYLPQAKCYDGACALGPGIVLVDDPGDVAVSLAIVREGREVFRGDARTSQMKRRFSELAEYLVREMTFPGGVFLMTGTGIVPGGDFTLVSGDSVTITVGELTLQNEVA
ncbi:fumarylacetoacetate hydrolase [bacterium]|nr:MAG: fumarylacetoacetate hydrolase [bacterium]